MISWVWWGVTALLPLQCHLWCFCPKILKLSSAAQWSFWRSYKEQYLQCTDNVTLLIQEICKVELTLIKSQRQKVEKPTQLSYIQTKLSSQVQWTAFFRIIKKYSALWKHRDCMGLWKTSCELCAFKMNTRWDDGVLSLPLGTIMTSPLPDLRDESPLKSIHLLPVVREWGEFPIFS